MKAKLKIEKEFDIKFLQVEAGARYWENAKVNGVEDTEGDLIPFRKGDYWCPLIDIETGIIQDWPKGTTAKTHYKVCDDGLYRLLDAEKNTIATKEGYVPNILDVERKSYGDYIILNINEDGLIANWDSNPDISDFENED